MKALRSLRYFHERTGEAMPAYIIGGYVIDKARRDWDARPYRGSTGNPDRRKWWEVRRHSFRARPEVPLGIGDVLFEANTLRECRYWIEAEGA